jgi:hypothetical protein
VHHALMNALKVNVSSKPLKPFRPDQAVVGIKNPSLITRLRDVYLRGVLLNTVLELQNFVQHESNHIIFLLGNVPTAKLIEF